MTILPSATDIKATLNTDAASPLDFLKQNLRPVEQVTPNGVTPSAPVASVTPEPVVIVPDPRPKEEEKPLEPVVEAKVEPIVEDLDPEEPIQDTNPLLEEAKKKLTPFDHIKDLRKVNKERKKIILEKETELFTVKQELERYKTGEAVPEVVEGLKTKVNELKYYQNLHDLRTSDEYTENLVRPLEESIQKARDLATEYQVDPAVLDKALEIEDKKQLNKYLVDNFGPLGAIEAKTVLNDVIKRKEDVYNAENEPISALEAIKAASNNAKQLQETHRINEITTNSSSGWVDALTELRESGHYPELVLTGDPENDKIVQPILESAASEYGKMVTFLGQNGTKSLPKELAKVEAKRYLLSQAAGIMAKSRAEHYRHATELKENTTRQASMIRPALGKGTGGMEMPPPSMPKDPKAGAADLLASVMSKKSGR